MFWPGWRQPQKPGETAIGRAELRRVLLRATDDGERAGRRAAAGQAMASCVRGAVGQRGSLSRVPGECGSRWLKGTARPARLHARLASCDSEATLLTRPDSTPATALARRQAQTSKLHVVGRPELTRLPRPPLLLLLLPFPPPSSPSPPSSPTSSPSISFPFLSFRFLFSCSPGSSVPLL